MGKCKKNKSDLIDRLFFCLIIICFIIGFYAVGIFLMACLISFFGFYQWLSLIVIIILYIIWKESKGVN